VIVRKAMRRISALMTVIGVLPCVLAAQGTRTPFERVRTLAAQGDSARARALADSIAGSTTATVSEQAEAAYWRGALASSPRERRLQFAKVAVEFSSTPAAGDALFRLAQMDLAAGDRAGARTQLNRAFRDYGSSSTAGDAAFELAQLLLADGDAREGCAALDSAVQWTAAEQVEKRNRMNYARRPCASLPAEAPKDSQPVTARGASGAGEPSGTRGGPGTSTSGRGVATRAWSAQVGAFATKADADRVAARLTERGYEARVTSERPFRVRIGRFSKRADAAAMVTKLKGEKTAAILVEAERR
jgi:cell division septation protein DedD